MSSTDSVIIFVPGIRAKPPPAVQKDYLRQCLTAGVRRAGGSAAEAAALAAALELVGWSYQFYGVHEDIAPFVPGIEALLQEGGDPEQDRRDALTPQHRLTALMYAIGDLFPGLGSLFATRRMETRLEEVNRYFNNVAGAGAAIRAQLRARLQAAWDAEQRILLVGHSFGSVIAYDTLWQLTHLEQHPGRVDEFISMGSPLALRYIRKRLQGNERKGVERYPGNIERWLNLTSVGEVAALDRTMAATYAPMRALGLLDEITDDLELLNRFRGPFGLNVHKCYGYFASPTAGAAALAWHRRTAAPASGRQQ